MKKLKLFASAIAITSILALTACDMKVKDPYTLPDSVDSVVEIDENTWSITATDGLIDFEGKSDVFDVSKFGTKWSDQAATSICKIANPLFGKASTDYSAVTIEFDMYAKSVQQYLGVLGFYNTAVGGFYWFTNSGMWINTTANAGSNPFFYFDYNQNDIAAGSAEGLNKWMHVKFVIDEDSYEYSIDDEVVFANTGDKVPAGTDGDVADAYAFLFDYADAIRLGTGVAFWDGIGTDTYVTGIKVTVTPVSE